jgi:hypothetical protein
LIDAMKQLSLFISVCSLLLHRSCLAQQQAGDAPSLFTPITDEVGIAAAADTQLPRDLDVVKLRTATGEQEISVELIWIRSNLPFCVVQGCARQRPHV